MLKISAPEETHSAIRAVLEEAGFQVEFVDSDSADIRVEKPCREEGSGENTLFQGGTVSCPSALALAEKAGIPPRLLGRLLNALEIKVRRCSLGLFG